MIRFVVTRDHAYTFKTYLQTWGRALAPVCQCIFYDQLIHFRTLEPAVHIFSDLERLDAAGLRLAELAFEVLSRTDHRAFNNPTTVLRRGPLLGKLHDAGLNPFAVHRADADLSRVRFPAFVRQENDHTGSLTGLLHSTAELADALQKLAETNTPVDSLLVVEFFDTADRNGIYRKYSAFIVGNQIIPRHLLHGHEWVLKFPSLVDEHTVAEEIQFLSSNPHEKQLGDIFRLAGIDYGRIDYSRVGDRIVVWEINTNPTITVEPMKIAIPRFPGQARFASAINETFLHLSPQHGDRPVPIHVPWSLKRDFGLSTRDIALR